MYWGTHIGIPILAASAIDLLRLKKKKKRIFTDRQIHFIGAAGVLPDILWPHLSLASRHSSWTHTLWFLILLLPIVLIVSKKLSPNNWKVFSIFFVAAALIHIVLDGLAGGVSFLYPLGEVYGDYYIPWKAWFYSDLVFVTITAITFYYLRKRSKKSHDFSRG